MRRLLLVLAVLALVLVAGLLLALRSESFALSAARWAVAAFTPLRLELRNPHVDVYAGRVSADELHLLPGAASGPPLLSVLGLSAELPRSLHADSVLIYTSDKDQAQNPQPMQWLGYLRWLPDLLRIGQLHLVTASTITWIFPLKELHGERTPEGRYLFGAQADYAGEPLGIEVELLAIDRGWGVTDADAKVTLAAPRSSSVFLLSGTLKGTADDFHYRFTLDAYYSDIREFLRGFEGGGDLAGRLQLSGYLVGDTAGFEVSDAHFRLDNLPDYGFEARGRLGYRFSGESSIDLQAGGELASFSYLVDWIDLDLGDLGRAHSTLRLAGSLDRPVIEAFELSAENDAGLRVSVGGRLNLFDAGPEVVSTNALTFDVRGPTLAVLERWLGKLPVDIGPWRVEGRLGGDRQHFTLSDLAVTAGDPDSVQLLANGSVGSIVRQPGAEPPFAVSGIDIAVSGRATDPEALRAVLQSQAVPSFQQLTASVTLRGDAEALALSDGELSVTDSDLQAHLGPLSGVLHAQPTARLTGLAAPLTLALSDSSALSQYTTLPVPVLGPVRVSARLAQQGDAFQLRDISGRVGDDASGVALSGQIDDLATFDGISLLARLRAVDTYTVLATLLPGFHHTQPLGTLSGGFTLRRQQARWSLSGIDLATRNSALELELQGDIGDLTGAISADLDARFKLAERSLLEALAGLPLAAVEGGVTVTSTPGQVHGRLTTRVGETSFTGNADIAVRGAKVDAVSLQLATPHLFLEDLGVADTIGVPPEDGGRETDTAAVPEDADGTPTWLARLREQAPPYPVSIILQIGGISGRLSSIDSLDVRLSGVDNRYTLEDFSARYNRAQAEIRGIIDLNPQPPAMSLAGQATALPLGDLLQDFGVKTSVTGNLTILGGITVTGDTVPAMTGSLNGNMAFALDNAVIEGAAYDLLATDLLAWIYSGALTEKSTRLDCTMARFEVRDGVATTDSLYIESPRMVATGRATFDLVKRRMDLRITPLSKSRMLQVPSEVRLKGDMADPKADVSPVAAVADAATSALTLIPELTLKLFGIGRDSGTAYRPCQAELGN